MNEEYNINLGARMKLTLIALCVIVCSTIGYCKHLEYANDRFAIQAKAEGQARLLVAPQPEPAVEAQGNPRTRSKLGMAIKAGKVIAGID